MEIPNSVRYFQRLNEMVKELTSEMRGEKMPRLIDADALCRYANNLKDKQIDANDIMRFPTVDVEPVRHGHWILQTNGHGVCSTCGTSVDLLNGMTWEYCPNCGAKMDEERMNMREI